MFVRCHGTSQLQLVNNLAQQGIFKSDKVRQILLSVDRTDFTSSSPYEDCPQRIGFGATISAPHMHASALHNLEDVIREDSRILDVGSGSGYLVACFAKIIGSKGKVYGIDHIEELVEQSKKNIQKHHADLIGSGRIELITGDGRLGYPPGAPYDAIHVGAAASELPQPLLDQLAIGGRMLIPVSDTSGHGQEFLQVDKLASGKIETKTIAAVIYVPLTSREHQLRSY